MTVIKIKLAFLALIIEKDIHKIIALICLVILQTCFKHHREKL